MSGAISFGRRFVLIGVCLLAGLSAVASPAVAQLNIEEPPIWGFDDRVRLNRFNLLTVKLQNLSSSPWVGDLRLEGQPGIGSRDIPVVQPEMYIEPGGRRTLQFLIYVTMEDSLQLSWGRRTNERQRIDIGRLSSVPAEVQFIDESSLGRNAGPWTRFSTLDFPYSAAGLETLGTVHLDHVPVWSEAQQRAFLDWLSSGGTLHLYPETGGDLPEFSSTLAILNDPSDEFVVGRGKVIRSPNSISQSVRAPAEDRKGTGGYLSSDATSEILSRLKGMTQPDHNWPLIYFMAVVYVLLLFPGCWLLGRKRGDYRLTYGVLLGIVTLFSLGFRTVGARGYGEVTSMESVALARPASDGRMLVTQWTNLFVTRGAEYDIRYAVEGAAYSTGQSFERVPGFAFNRPQSAFLTEVPSFSSRTFMHTGVVQDDQLPLSGVTIKYNAQGTRLASITFPDDSLWNEDPAFRAWIASGGTLHQLNKNPGNQLRPAGAAMQLESLLSHGYRSPYVFSSGEEPPALFNQAALQAIAFDFGLSAGIPETPDDPMDTLRLPKGDDRLYLDAKMPASYHAVGDRFPEQRGRVIYVVPFKNLMAERESDDNSTAEDTAPTADPNSPEPTPAEPTPAEPETSESTPAATDAANDDSASDPPAAPETSEAANTADDDQSEPDNEDGEEEAAADDPPAESTGD